MLNRLLAQYRRYLTNYESTLAYALLGLIGGIASGLIVLAFEVSIQEIALLWGVDGSGEGFESLPRWALFALPVAGAVVLGVVFSFLRPEDRETGIVHVLSRMHSHYGVLPVRNAIVQFIAGAFALATGQSGGREGPGVHLGGAINSQLGQRLGLPNNSLRVLIACGTAGGIAAAFNTPLAGVIFAMEVIVAEYTVAGFLPVILAAVSAAAISRQFGGGAAEFSMPPVTLNSLWEIPYVVLLGACCGAAIALFIRISRLSAGCSHWPVLLRFTLAGLLTGSMAIMVPQILGIGYDTLGLVLAGKLSLALLLAIAASKLIATAFSAGMGMPIGLIGPSLLIGACMGGALGTVGQELFPQLASQPALYIMLGMGAAMGAVLSAPLAAILAIIELTQTISIAMPAMLAIVTANLTNTGVFRQRSAHQTVLRHLKRQVPDDPLNQLLHRTNVTSSMEISVTRMDSSLAHTALDTFLNATPGWCLLTRDGEDLYLVNGNALSDWLRAQEESDDEQPIDLTHADIRRWSVVSVPEQATLRQTMDALKRETAEAALVYSRGTGGQRVLQGIVTRESIERFSLARL
ncbi:MAG: chloride channel protein [Halieaceae bacterium]|nr:chloride channel protein [Halieaceae bacterium]